MKRDSYSIIWISRGVGNKTSIVLYLQAIEKTDSGATVYHYNPDPRKALAVIDFQYAQHLATMLTTLRSTAYPATAWTDYPYGLAGVR